MIEVNENTSIVKKQQKHYSTPKIDIIADVKTMTKGATLGNADAGNANGPVPYDPGA